jgi:hypothetical protein
MADPLARGVMALLVALALGFALSRLGRIPRDLALAIFAVSVAVLGIFAVFGVVPGVIGAAIILSVFGLGAILYGLLALAERVASR